MHQTLLKQMQCAREVTSRHSQSQSACRAQTRLVSSEDILVMQAAEPASQDRDSQGLKRHPAISELLFSPAARLLVP